MCRPVLPWRYAAELRSKAVESGGFKEAMNAMKMQKGKSWSLRSRIAFAGFAFWLSFFACRKSFLRGSRNGCIHVSSGGGEGLLISWKSCPQTGTAAAGIHRLPGKAEKEILKPQLIHRIQILWADSPSS